MKKFIITTVMALLIGGFAFTANAQVVKVPGQNAQTEKQVKPEGKKPNLKSNVNENSMQVQQQAKDQAKKAQADAEAEKAKAEAEKARLAAKQAQKEAAKQAQQDDAAQKAKEEAELKAKEAQIKANTDNFNKFVNAVDNCEKNYNKKDGEKNQFETYLKQALGFREQIDTNLLNEGQKTTYKEKNDILKGYITK